jgi:hypothetical protein
MVFVHSGWQYAAIIASITSLIVIVPGCDTIPPGVKIGALMIVVMALPPKEKLLELIS